MAVNYTTSSGATSIDPTIQPYLAYGLEEAQKLYQSGATPNVTTQQALNAMRQRALQGNPLVGAAQGQLASTIGGQYLSGNPFFQGAFTPAAEAAQQAFQKGIGDISSAASKAGRYGVNAATQNLFGGNANTFAKALTGTAGQLAYQNYADERQRQLAATAAAPAMSEQDYSDISRLMSVGQFEQNFPRENLTSFLSSVYGNPISRFGSSTQTSPYYTNPTANALGLGLLGAQFANAASPLVGKATNWLGSQWDKWTANPAVANAPDNIDIGGGWSPAGAGSFDFGNWGGYTDIGF